MPKSAYVIAVALVLALASWAAPTQAQSQRAFVDPYLAAKLTLGLGGSVDVSRDVNNVRVTGTEDLTVSFGLGAQYLFPLHDYFSLGGLLQLQSWRSTNDGGGGRNLVFDLAVLPQAKYVILPGKLELYFAIPIGVALDFWNEVDVTSSWLSSLTGGIAGGNWEGNTALGFVVGALLGARFQLNEDLGLLLELGYLYRTIGHSVTVRSNVGNFANDADVNVSWGQFQLNIGVYF